MPALVRAIVESALVTFSSVFFLVDPFAVIPIFLSVAPADRAESRRVARRAAWTCALVLAAFAAGGALIFQLFSITLPAFKIAGGIILIGIGLEMLQARRSETKQTPEEAAESAHKEDPSIIPLGMPMLAGPGAIADVMVLMGDAKGWWHVVILFAAIALTSWLAYVILGGAERLARTLGQTGIRIMTRIMGLILVAIAVQFIINGFADLGWVKRLH